MSAEENSVKSAEVEDEDSFVVIDEVTDTQTENDKDQGTELGSELLINSVEAEKEIEFDEVTDNQTENDKGQGTEIGSELLIDSAETEKEIDSFLKNESKPQETTVEEKKASTVEKHTLKEEKKTDKAESRHDNKITSRYTLSVGGLRTGDKRILTQMLLKRFGKNKYIMKPTRLGDKYTYLYFRSRECMKTAEKMLNNKMISGHRISAKAVEKKKPEKKTETKEKKEVTTKSKVPKEDNFGAEDYNEQVKYKEKYSRHQVLSLGDTLELYLPPLKSLISDRKKRHNGLICKVDKLKQCAPKNGAYCKCSFLIDLDADTGKPILGRFHSDGKVRKNWKGKQFYHSSIIEAAEVFEKFIISSKWEVGRCNKGFWRKIHFRCNKSGELLLWLLVQSPEDKSSEELKKLKALLTEFFQKGEGKKCKISSIYTRCTFTSSVSNPRGGSVVSLTMGKEHFEDNVLGFKIKINPKVSTLWNMEQSSMMCDAVKDLMALDDHTSVIIIGLNDSGLLALTLANQAGEVICVDKRMPVAEAKMNAAINKLGSKCKFYAGFASEELRKISPKYKKAYAVVLVPTVIELMAFKERKNLSAVKSIVTFLECSKLNSRPMKLLADPQQGAAFFPSRIIPFDTHPNEKTYMMAVRLERVHVPDTKKTILRNLTKSSSSRSSRAAMIRRYRERRARLQHRAGISVPEKRERNRMLPDAREVILARRYRKEKEQLKSAPRFSSYEQPNLVIEVKKPSYGNTVPGEAYAERYVKERRIEAEEYRQRNMEERAMKFRGKSNIQDVLTDSLKQTLPSINLDTAEKLKQVIAEAITDAGFLAGSSSRERKKRTPTPPRAADHRSEHYPKYNHSSIEQRYERDTPVLRHMDEGRRIQEKQIEINRNSYRNSPRNDKRLHEEKYERISPAPLRISPNYMHDRKNSLEVGKRYEVDKYDLDRRSNEVRINEDRSYGSRRDIHRNDYTKEVLPSSSKRSHDNEERLRRTEHEQDLLPARRVEADEYKRGIRSSFDRIGAREQRNVDRRDLDLMEYEKQNSTLTRRSLEAREMQLHKRVPPQSHIYDEREMLLARKRALEMQPHVSDHSEKRRRSQDHDPYERRDLSSIKRRTLGDHPYRSSERAAEIPHYLLKEDVSHARKMTDVDRYERALATERINERDRDLIIRRQISNTLPEVPNRGRDRDYRHPAAAIEKQSILAQAGFNTLQSGSAAALDRRPVFQSLDRHMGPDSMLSSSNYSLSSLQRNMNLTQPPSMDFRRPYSSFGPPR